MSLPLNNVKCRSTQHSSMRQIFVRPFLIFPPPRYRCVDLRTVSYEVPPQEMLSRDSVTVSVDAVCFYKISNPLAAVCNVGNYTHSTNLLVATSLRNVLGTKTLAEILSERETICHVMEHILDEATRPWGVKASIELCSPIRIMGHQIMLQFG